MHVELTTEWHYQHSDTNFLLQPPAEKGNSVSQASAGSKKRAAPAVNTSPPPAKRQAKAPSPPPRPGPDKGQ